MCSVQAGDGADRLSGCGVDHFNAGTVGNVQTVGRRVGEQVIPAAIAADFPTIEQVVGLLC